MAVFTRLMGLKASRRRATYAARPARMGCTMNIHLSVSSVRMEVPWASVKRSMINEPTE